MTTDGRAKMLLAALEVLTQHTYALRQRVELDIDPKREGERDDAESCSDVLSGFDEAMEIVADARNAWCLAEEIEVERLVICFDSAETSAGE